MPRTKPTTLKPKLRFPAFRDQPGWEVNRMERYLTESRIKGSKGDEAQKITVKLWGKGVYAKEESIQGSASTQYYERKAGQFIYSKLDFLNQAFGIIPEHLDGFESTVDLPCFDITDELNPMFLLEYVKREPFYKKQGEIADGGRKARRIQAETFLDCPIYVPTPAEQRAIADCLGSVDAWLAAAGRKLAALRDHKRGLMQQLFPQPGQSQPQQRFPEFRDARKWEQQSVASLYTFKPNNNYSRDQLNYESGTVKNIHYGDIHTRFATQFRINVEHVPFVNDDALPKKIKDEAFCRAGDVIFADASEDLADVGKCIEIIDVGAERVLSGSHTILTRPRSKSIAVGFAGYLFKSRMAREGIEKEAHGTKVMQISPKRLASVSLLFPADLKEQQKIAACLTALDTQITAQAAQIESLKTHKHGLMQQLFPSPEEN